MKFSTMITLVATASAAAGATAVKAPVCEMTKAEYEAFRAAA